MPDIDTDWLHRTIRKAGDIALSHFGRTRGTLKPDNSWVTRADIEVETCLREELALARPHDAILGEEGDNPRPRSPVVWAIDPIDGTRAFNHGLPVWGISIGMFLDGVPTIGAFLLPVPGDLYYTDGKAAYCNGIPLKRPSPPIDPNAVFLISEGASENFTIDYPGKILSLGSAAAHLCYVARGSAVGTLDQAAIWDYAASAAILRVLGIPFRYASGPEVDFAQLYDGRPVPEPTLICPPHHFPHLQKALRTQTQT